MIESHCSLKWSLRILMQNVCCYYPNEGIERRGDGVRVRSIPSWHSVLTGKTVYSIQLGDNGAFIYLYRAEQHHLWCACLDSVSWQSFLLARAINHRPSGSTTGYFNVALQRYTKLHQQSATGDQRWWWCWWWWQQWWRGVDEADGLSRTSLDKSPTICFFWQTK